MTKCEYTPQATTEIEKGYQHQSSRREKKGEFGGSNLKSYLLRNQISFKENIKGRNKLQYFETISKTKRLDKT